MFRINNVLNTLSLLIADEEGQDLVEYAIVLIFVVVVCVVGLSTLGSTLVNFYLNRVAEIFA